MTRVSFVLAAVAAGAVLFAGPPARAGFFEDLFGIRQPAPPVAPPAPKPVRRKPRQVEILRETRRSDARAERLAAIAALQKANPGSMEVFYADDTLRQGDVVASKDGFVVFRGGGGQARSAKDFVPLASAGGVSNRPELMARQAASRVPGAPSPAAVSPKPK